CGALAVSRLLCSPEFPTRAELDHYLAYGSSHRALREDSRLNHLHWATTRRDIPKTLRVLAMEGRSELRQLALRRSVPVERLARLRSASSCVLRRPVGHCNASCCSRSPPAGMVSSRKAPPRGSCRVSMSSGSVPTGGPSSRSRSRVPGSVARP